jgi:protein-S-isoprenylcysteine O-methyltransferase Ste14
MSDTLLNTVARIGLPIYVVVFFGVAMVWRSYRVWRHTGVNPYVLTRGEDAHSYVGGLFRLALVAVAAIVALFAASSEAYGYLAPIPWLSKSIVALIGFGLLIVALIWVFVAQSQMGDSFRIGVDTERATPLVRQGLFGVSRNPIFLGMLVMLLGFFLVLPSAASLAVCVLGYALIQIQVRLEEAHLVRLHGDAYRQYQVTVRRWL